MAGGSFWDGLDLPSLRRAWEQTLGAAPPSSLSRVFLRRVLAYERQCRTYGGHSAATRRTLTAMANGTPEHSAPAGSVSAGTHLVREWNGRTYQVEILDSGYRFDGKTYPSLTTITKRITGTPSCAKTRPFRNSPQISSLDALGIRAKSRVFRAAGRRCCTALG